MTKSKCSPRCASSGTRSAAFPSRPTESARPSFAAARTFASASSKVSVDSSRYRVSSRRSIRAGSTSMQRIAAPAIVAAKGWAPPMPPRPAVRIVFPLRSGDAEVLLSRGSEGLVGALEDSLCADVDPAASRHLAEHREPERFQAAKLLPRGPTGDEEGVGDEDARRPRMRAEDADRLAALDEQRLVLAEHEERADKRLQRCVVSRCLAGAAVDDELLGLLRDLAVEVVEKHAERGLRLPRARVERLSARSADRRQIAAELLHHRVELAHAHESSPASASTAATSAPERIASATRSMSGERVLSSSTGGETWRTKSCAALVPAPGSSGARNSTP